MGTLRNITNDDRNAITYRPRWRSETGSVLATILLQQISYRFEKNQDKPFYKFKEPCGHDLYREGDSWIEELGFSRTEFDTAIEKIGQKISRKTPRDPNKLVWYWITPERVTWYELNVAAYETMLERIYVNQESCVTKSVNPDLRSAGILIYENQDSRDRYTETTTETTTETNNKGEGSDRDLPAVQPATFSPPLGSELVSQLSEKPKPEPSPIESLPIQANNPTPPPSPLPAQSAGPIGVVGAGDPLINQAVARFNGEWQRREKHAIDGLTGQVAALDVTMPVFREMVDTFLDKHGLKEVAGLDTDLATRTLTRAQQIILSICAISPRFRSVADLESIFTSWRENDYRGDTLPNGDQLIEHAGKMKAGAVVCERKKGQTPHVAANTTATHRNSSGRAEQPANTAGRTATDFSRYNRNRRSTSA